MAISVSTNSYAFANPAVAREGGQVINLFNENQGVSIELQENLPIIDKDAYQLIIVPGYTPLKTKMPHKITQITQQRLQNAVAQMKKRNIKFIMTSGGNVHPPATPYNEAFGMKSYLNGSLGVPQDRIAIDPYARHSTTNLRNCGRFMISHGLKRALIVTSFDQNFYFGFQGISTFAARSKKELGYKIGHLRFLGTNLSSFVPSDLVFTRGSDPADP